MTKTKLKIDGMHCTSCSMLIDGDLEDTQGVICAKTNYAKAVTELEFDEKQVNLKDLIKVIEKSGYQVSSS